jgi:hypothetical protein
VKNTPLFFLCLCGAVILVYFLAAGGDSGVDPASLLPENTALLIDMKKPAASMNRMRKSRLGRQLASIRWQEVPGKAGWPGDRIRVVADRYRSLATAIPGPLFSELFGRRALFALIPALKPGKIQADGGPPGSRMVLILQPRHRASMVDFFGSYFVKKIESTRLPYKGRVIRTYVIDDTLFLFSSVTDGLVIASFSPDAIRRCIDISISNMASGKSGLSGSERYRYLKKKTQGRDDLFVYADFRNLRDIMNQASGTWSSSLMDQLPVRSFTLYREPQENLLRLSAAFQYGPAAAGQEKFLLPGYRQPGDTFSARLPNNIVAHIWTRIFDPAAIWRGMQDGSNDFSDPYVLSLKTWLQEKTGLSGVDFPLLFGSRASLTVTAVRSSGFFSIPSILLRFEMTSREKVRRLLSQILDELDVRRSIINKREVFTVMLGGGLMQPSYTFLGGFLVVADSRRQLEKILVNNREPLLKAPLYKKVDVGLTDRNNLITCYVKAELIGGLKDILLWYSSLLPRNDSDSTWKTRQIIDTILIPVLEGMKMYRAESIRVFHSNTGKEIIMNSAFLLEKTSGE